jgi:hypothetical protein
MCDEQYCWVQRPGDKSSLAIAATRSDISVDMVMVEGSEIDDAAAAVGTDEGVGVAAREEDTAGFTDATETTAADDTTGRELVATDVTEVPAAIELASDGMDDADEASSTVTRSTLMMMPPASTVGRTPPNTSTRFPTAASKSAVVLSSNTNRPSAKTRR